MGPYRQASTIVGAMMLMAVGNGLLSTMLPVRLHAAGTPGAMVGTVVTAYAVGMLLGCLFSGSAIRRVGHIRAFSAFASVNAVCALGLDLGVYWPLWALLRVAAGFSVTAAFVVSQSWLNELTTSAHRGRIMSLFYVSFTVSLGAGAWLAGQMGAAGKGAFTLPAALYAVAVVAIALTRVQAPLPPERIRVDLRAVWAVSPVGLVGVFVSGALGMTFQGIGAAWGSAVGLPVATIGLLMMCTQLGNLTIQWPLGWVSDHTDRRNVLIAAAGLVLVSALLLARGGAGEQVLPLALLLLTFALFGGAAETLYSVSTAQANDHAGSGDYVTVTSTLLVTWSTGATLGPMVGTAAMSALGPPGLFWYFVVIAVLFAVFALLRRFARAPASEAQHEDFVALPAAPVISDWNPNAPDEAAPAPAPATSGTGQRPGDPPP